MRGGPYAMTIPKATGAPSTNGVHGRTQRPPGQLWQVPAFLVGLLALTLVAATAPLAPTDSDNELERDLAEIRQALEKPGKPADAVIALAESAVAHTSQQPELSGEAHFLLGAIYMRIAENSPAEKAKEEREKATLHLELADLRGVAPTDRARLQYLRGKLLYMHGGDLARAIELLTKSLPDGADNIAEGYGLLVQAHLKKSSPNLDAALAANLKQMENCDDDAVLNQARLLRGELLIKKEMRSEAVKVLDQITAKAPKALRQKARQLQARAATEEGMWSKAIALWRELLQEPSAVTGGRGHILYFLGHCLAQYDTPAHMGEAVQAWQEAMATWKDTPPNVSDEAQAAAIRLAEVHLFSNKESEQIGALDELRKALKKVSVPGEFKNKVIDIGKVRDLLEDACQVFNRKQDTEHFLQAAELFKKVAPPGVGDEKIAQAAEAHGRELLEKAKNAGPDEGRLKEQGRTQLQMAALAYADAAEARSPAERSEPLWHCIECYRLAGAYPQAIEVLQKFVVLPLAAEDKAEAWYALAEAQRQLRLPDAAESYKMCVACNNAAYAARARLHLADIAIEHLELDQAEAILKQIINPGPLADRPAHEQAMWQLGLLLLQREKHEQAAIQFRELLLQYPAHPKALAARDYYGDCYRKLAALALANSDGPEVSAQKKQYYTVESRKDLQQAQEIYQQLVSELDMRAKSQPLSPAEDKLRRKALFAVADCFFALPSGLEQGFYIYQQIWQRYAKEADGLWAASKLHSCFFVAFQTRSGSMDLMREAADDAIETCLRNFNDYVQAGVFKTEEEKTSWQSWLQVRSNELRKLKRGEQG